MRLSPSDVRTIDGTAEWVLVEYRRDGCWMCERFEADTLPAFKREFVATGKMAFATIDVTAQDLLGVPLKFGSPPRLFIGTRTPDGGVDVRIRIGGYVHLDGLKKIFEYHGMPR